MILARLFGASRHFCYNMDPAKISELIDVKMSQNQNNLLSELDNLISSRLNNFQQSFWRNTEDFERRPGGQNLGNAH